MTRLGPQDLTQVGPTTAHPFPPISTLQLPNDTFYGKIFLVIKIRVSKFVANNVFNNVVLNSTMNATMNSTNNDKK